MNKKDLKQIAQQIKEKRKSYGYTQEQLEMSYSYYTKIENGYQTPSLNTLVKIASALHISLDKLIYGKTPENPQFSPDAQELLQFIDQYDRNELIRCKNLLAKIISCLNN